MPDFKGGPVGTIAWRDVGEVSGKDLRSLLDDYRRAIMGLCALRLPAVMPEPAGHHALVGKLIARDPSLGRVKLLTTNCDTLIEQVLDDLGIQSFEGFRTGTAALHRAMLRQDSDAANFR